MKLKETIAITIAALAFLLITGVAKAEDKTIKPQEFVKTVSEVPGKVGIWFNDEVTKTKEYQKKSWAKTKEDFASLVKKFGLLDEKNGKKQ